MKKTVQSLDSFLWFLWFSVAIKVWKRMLKEEQKEEEKGEEKKLSKEVTEKMQFVRKQAVFFLVFSAQNGLV